MAIMLFIIEVPDLGAIRAYKLRVQRCRVPLTISAASTTAPASARIHTAAAN